MNNLSNPAFESLNWSKRGLFLFILFELLVISSNLLVHYEYVLLVFTVLAFIFLNFMDVKITLLLMIAYSTRIIYFHGMVSAIMMIILGLIFVLVCFSVCLKFCMGKIKITKTKLDLPIWIFLGMVFFQTVRGLLISNPPKWVGTEFLAYLGFGIVFLVTTLCENREIIRKFFQMLIIMAYYHSIVGLWNYFQVGQRIGGYLFNPFTSMIALVLLNLSFYAKEKSQKLIYLAISLPLLLHLLFSFTRGYWFGFQVGLFFSYGIYILNSKIPFQRKLLGTLKGAVLFGFTIILIMFTFQQFILKGNVLTQLSKRFISSFSTKYSAETGSNVARLIEYKACWNQIKKNPVFGFGVGYNLPITNPVRHRRTEEWGIHQFYLMITLKMGLIGLLVFLWIFYVFLKEGIKESKTIQDGYYKGLSYGFIANAIQLLVISFTNHEFASVNNNFYLAFALAGVMVISSKRSENYNATINYNSQLEC